MQKIGLALGSGAAWGMAHIGVLEVLEREGIHVDMVAGTSAGAVIGALHAQGKDIREVKRIVLSLGWPRLLPLVDLTLLHSGLIAGRRVTAWLRTVVGREVTFRDLGMPFACVATDVVTGEEVVMTEGSVLEALRASIAIPGIFTVVRRGNRFLVDGSLANAVPVNVLRSMGARFVIAVNVLADIVPDSREKVSHGRRGKGGVKEPGIMEVLSRSLYIGVSRLAKSDVQGADVVIEPRLGNIGPLEFHHAREAVLQGELAALAAIPKLKRLLGVSSPDRASG